jgi:hypothetical protein
MLGTSDNMYLNDYSLGNLLRGKGESVIQWVNVKNNKELKNLEKIARTILHDEYDVYSVCGEDTLGKNSERFVKDKIIAAKYRNKKVWSICNRMCQRSFSIPDINVAILTYDNGDIAAMIQRISRILTNGNKDKTGYVIDFSIDKNRHSKVIDIIFETAKEISKLFSVIGYEGKTIDIFNFSEDDVKNLSFIERKTLPYVEKTIHGIKKAANAKVFGGQEITAPIVIDNFVKQWTQSIGSSVLALSDASLKAAGITKDKVRPPKQWVDVPFVGAIFARDFSANTVFINEFDSIYKNIEKFKKTKSIEESKMNSENESERLAFNEEAYDSISDYLDERLDLDDYQQTIRELQQEIVNTSADPNIPNNEKQQLINSYFYNMNATAKAAVLLNRQIEENSGKSSLEQEK